MRLPPPTTTTTTNPADGRPTDATAPAELLLDNEDRAAAVAAALDAMHAAAAAAASLAPEQPSSNHPSPVPVPVPAAAPPPPANPTPPPPLPSSPLSRAHAAALLRACLSAPLPADDAVRACEPDVLALLPGRPAEAMRVAHARLHVFPFKDVGRCWLRAWVEGSLWRAVEVLEEGGGDWVAEVVRVVDMALILAGGVGREGVCESLAGDI
ncbi:clavaminate synthase-like protein [Neofusicoccum parvum]|nr:clavaminate synthase-like protein [Neofusicoccum parvum]